MLKLTLALLIFWTDPAIPEPAADNTQISFSGKVVDESTGEPIPGACVFIRELDEQILTDFEGNFTLKNITPGKYNFNISFVSFNSAALENIDVNKNSPTLLVTLK